MSDKNNNKEKCKVICVCKRDTDGNLPNHNKEKECICEEWDYPCECHICECGLVREKRGYHKCALPSLTDSEEDWEEMFELFHMLFRTSSGYGKTKSFIHNLLSKAKSETREEIKAKAEKLRKRTVSKEHYPQITDNKIHDRAIYNQALQDLIDNI